MDFSTESNFPQTLHSSLDHSFIKRDSGESCGRMRMVECGTGKHRRLG